MKYPLCHIRIFFLISLLAVHTASAGSDLWNFTSPSTASSWNNNANWTDYPGGDSSPMGMPISPANPAVFYRLIK